jgi:hypothetical protein
MRRLALLLRFELQATPPTGDPPSFDITSGQATVTLLEGDASEVPTEVSYKTHVTITGATSFVEEGEMVLDYGALALSTVGAGVLEPTEQQGISRGAVIFRIAGSGGLSGAAGLVTSNFEFNTDTGAAVEHQVLRLSLA